MRAARKSSSRVVREADAAARAAARARGGSNLVVADAGFAGTVVRILTRGVEEHVLTGGIVRLDVQAGEPWDPLVARASRPGSAASSASPGSPGRRAPPRSRTSVPTGRRWPTRSSGSGCSTARAMRSTSSGPRTAASLPLQRRSSASPAAGSCWRSATRSQRSDASRPVALRRAGRRPGRRARHRRAAGRRARGGPGPAPGQGHGARPRRPGFGQRRLVLHQSDPDGRPLRRAAGARRQILSHRMAGRGPRQGPRRRG